MSRVNALPPIIAALEALEDGDVGLCAEILRGVIEELSVPDTHCEVCGGVVKLSAGHGAAAA